MGVSIGFGWVIGSTAVFVGMHAVWIWWPKALPPMLLLLAPMAMLVSWLGFLGFSEDVSVVISGALSWLYFRFAGRILNWLTRFRSA